MVMQPMQQLTPAAAAGDVDVQPDGRWAATRRQMGLIGASPLSNHPLAGGSGAGYGAGLVRAASLPGAGGTLARTPLMAKLDRRDRSRCAVAPPVPRPAATAAGLAPVGAGGGGGPMGGMGQRGKSGGSKTGADGAGAYCPRTWAKTRTTTGDRPTDKDFPATRPERLAIPW